ncbi:hypothetical protein HYC85_029457 [Camellia sinensis]|uniref:BHLH domain-containing protein n=1 Tax=Camellia sinensis TaxID=4442 RepID=A0A7J7G227_CAMSI|nr:hypothetical protein HYC85_029457 [Camellia sinensis]
MLSQHDQLDQAATYIKQLKERIEELKSMKALAMSSNNTNNETTNTTTYDFKLPVFELRDFGSSLEVLLISGLKRNFKLYEVISVLQDEGADVVTASYATVGDKVFHTIHAQNFKYFYKRLKLLRNQLFRSSGKSFAQGIRHYLTQKTNNFSGNNVDVPRCLDVAKAVADLAGVGRTFVMESSQ